MIVFLEVPPTPIANQDAPTITLQKYQIQTLIVYQNAPIEGTCIHIANKLVLIDKIFWSSIMTIKKILSLLICLISLKSFAYDHSYDV